MAIVVVFTYSIRVLNLEWLDSGTTVGGLAKRTRFANEVYNTTDDRDGAEGERMKPSALY